MIKELFFKRWTQVRIENTNLCVNECIMCPREKLTRPTGIMSYADFCLILNKLEIEYKCILHLQCFGEPLIDKYLFDKIKYVKKNHQNFVAFLQTSLTIADEDICRQIVDSGVDIVGISLYGTNPEAYEKIFKKDNYNRVRDMIKFLREYADKCGSRIEVSQTDSQPEFLNFGDGRHYQAPEADKVCPFIAGKRKHVLQITWDGYIIPCCFDYNATIKLGNIFQKSIKEIFKSKEYIEFKKIAQGKDYSKYKICNNCDKKDV